MSATMTPDTVQQTNSPNTFDDKFVEVDLKESFSPEEETFLREIEAKIFSHLKFPEHWKDEDVSPPNSECKSKTYEVCKKLFRDYALRPNSILASIEEGIYLSFDSKSEVSSLIVEIYNNLEIATLVNDNLKKEVVRSADIINADFVDIVKKFNEFK